MIFKFRVLAVLSMVFVFTGCDDSLDEVYQANDEIVRSKLIKSIEVYYGDEDQPKIYDFKYTDENYLESFTVQKFGTVKMAYDAVDGSLDNFEEVANKMFYSDLILKIPYDYGEFFIDLEENNAQGDPTLIKMVLIKNGEAMIKYVRTTYDQTPNIHKPYLMAGGIVYAAGENNSNEGREQFFEEKFMPSKIPSNITYLDHDGKPEHMYFVQYEYNEEQLVTRGVVTYFNIISGNSPEITTVLYSYLDSAIKESF